MQRQRIYGFGDWHGGGGNFLLPMMHFETAAEDATPLEELEENERIIAVQQAMEQIGNPCRDILLLYYWEERSMEEIAVKLGFANADTVKSKKYQCKKALENLVKKTLGGVRAVNERNSQHWTMMWRTSKRI